jgi:hypothetical protein
MERLDNTPVINNFLPVKKPMSFLFSKLNILLGIVACVSARLTLV